MKICRRKISYEQRSYRLIFIDTFFHTIKRCTVVRFEPNVSPIAIANVAKERQTLNRGICSRARCNGITPKKGRRGNSTDLPMFRYSCRKVPPPPPPPPPWRKREIPRRHRFRPRRNGRRIARTARILPRVGTRGETRWKGGRGAHTHNGGREKEFR